MVFWEDHVTATHEDPLQDLLPEGKKAAGDSKSCPIQSRRSRSWDLGQMAQPLSLSDPPFAQLEEANNTVSLQGCLADEMRTHVTGACHAVESEHLLPSSCALEKLPGFLN